MDKEKCTGCGLCEAICPTNSITMEEGHPRGICLRCGLCAKVCPVNARVDVKRNVQKLKDKREREKGEKKLVEIAAD